MEAFRFRYHSLELQARDFDILQGLHESRLYTLDHIAALYFSGQREYAKKRIRQLKGTELIDERPRRPTQPAVMHLTRTGYELLASHGYLAGLPSLSLAKFENRVRVSPLTLTHELAVLDCKAAIVPAINALPGYSVAEFSTWPAKYQFSARNLHGESVTVKPDGFIRVHEELDGQIREHRFFLEVDRSTEVLQTLATRAACYLDYYRSGSFAAFMGADRANFKRFPFRVAMVFRSAERRNNIAERLLSATPPILTMTWLTTMNELMSDPLGTIWLTPRGYRDAVEGTAYAMKLGRSNWWQQEERGQSALVDARIIKRKLF